VFLTQINPVMPLSAHWRSGLAAGPWCFQYSGLDPVFWPGQGDSLPYLSTGRECYA